MDAVEVVTKYWHYVIWDDEDNQVFKSCLYEDYGECENDAISEFKSGYPQSYTFSISHPLLKVKENNKKGE